MKKIISTLIIVVLTLSVLCSCCASSDEETLEKPRQITSVEYDTDGKFIYTGEGDLYYDRDTQIVYYICVYGHHSRSGMVYMTPYFSENGRMYRFVQDSFVELSD